MLWFNQIPRPISLAGFLTVIAVVLSGCQVQPLNAVKPGASLSPATLLSGVEVLEVNNRVGQQVRNNLIFGLNGGANPTGVTHSIRLVVNASVTAISIEADTVRAPSASQVVVAAQYTLTEKSSNNVLATGLRQATASFDRANQSFANQRAERDAENRAAKEVAEQLRLLIAATLNSQ